MNAIHRRTFLAGCGVIGIGAMSASMPVTWNQIVKLSNESPLESDAGVLVLITLYGGNDGLNTVIPYKRSEYFDARPELAYAEEKVIDLDGEYGLNPGMTGSGELFDSGSLAIIRGVGYPEQDRSHFRSMDIWQTGSLDNQVTTGWIGRWLDSQKDNPLAVLNVGTVLPVLAIGSNSVAATLSPKKTTTRAEDSDLLTQLSAPDPDDKGAMKLVRDSYHDAAKASREIGQLVEAGGSTPADGDDRKLGSQLDIVSQCIKGGLPTRVYCVSLTGFDTHANEKMTQQSLLKTLDQALTKFVGEMANHQRGKRVVTVAYSEFGRRVAANASDGTDHGTSGPVLIAGSPVRGGFYGDDPSLTDLTGGDLKTTTDFRDVYAELLGGTLGTDPETILGPKRSPISFLK